MNMTRYKRRFFSIAIAAVVSEQHTSSMKQYAPPAKRLSEWNVWPAGVASWGQEERRTEVRIFDMFHATDEAFETIERLCRERGIELNTVCLPILFTNESVYRTADEIEGFLAKRRVLGTTGGSRYV